MSGINLIELAPHNLYPDLGCPSWPSCLDCPFSHCVYTADRTHPTQEQRRLAIQRAKIVGHTDNGMLPEDVATEMHITIGVVEHGIYRYRSDAAIARSKSNATATR